MPIAFTLTITLIESCSVAACFSCEKVIDYIFFVKYGFLRLMMLTR